MPTRIGTCRLSPRLVDAITQTSIRYNEEEQRVEHMPAALGQLTRIAQGLALGGHTPAQWAG
jgi:hypothetical protein